MPVQPERVADPRPWWRRVAHSRWTAAMYLLLGSGYLVTAGLTHDHAGWAIGPVWLLGGLLWLVRPRPALRDDGVIRVAGRWSRRRDIVVTDIEAFARPHPFDTTTLPSAVLRSGERVLLRDVDGPLLEHWSGTTGVPIVRDPKPPATSPAGRGAR